jgi:alkanesulfonate monooxygenase SsuD/methylene tetrahydromethanopterin reductase-like flavin-dependent oxidoreductase (luciferase family)
MDFGIIHELAVPRPWTPNSERDAYWNAIAQVQEAERGGFSHAWVVEHHFLEEFSHSSAPEVWLSALAQHTSRIRIGHGVVLMPPPFNHPVRVAERIAALDILSNGRVEFGMGRSITEEELGGFGIETGDSRPMLEESVELVRTIWLTDEPIEFYGKYVQLPRRRVVPRPIQRPHPPLWMACTSPDSFSLAGSLGVGVLAFAMAVDAPAMGRRIQEYRRGLSTHVSSPGGVNENIGVFFMTFCAPTDAEAHRVADAAFSHYMDQTMEYFLRWGRGGALPPGYEWYAEASRADNLADRLKFDYLVEHGMVLCGSPDTVCEQIESYAAVGATQMVMGIQLGMIPHEEVMKSIRLISDAVIPLFNPGPGRD